MPWVVGIDEAGYGPNLGPLVQAAVALYLPDDDLAGWETLKPVVRRCGEKADGRLLIDDSKKVYTSGGLEALERGVWSIMPRTHTQFAISFGVRTNCLCGGKTCAAKRGSMAAILFLSRSIRSRTGRIRTSCDRQSADGGSAISESFLTAVQPDCRRVRVEGDGPCSRSDRTDRSMTTSLEPGRGTTRLPLRQARRAELLRGDASGGVSRTGGSFRSEKSAEESRYRVELLDRPVTVTFRPRADGDSVAVGAGVDAVQVPPRSLHAAVQSLLGDARPRHPPHRRLPRGRETVLRRDPARDGESSG